MKTTKRNKNLATALRIIEKAIKEEGENTELDRSGPEVDEVLEMFDDGSIDRDKACKLLMKRGYREDAAKKMIDDYNEADL